MADKYGIAAMENKYDIESNYFNLETVLEYKQFQRHSERSKRVDR